MKEGKAKNSQLIIYPDGTLYHIDLKRSDDIPPNLLFVGAKERVDVIAREFDSVRWTHQNKSRPEFYIAVGAYKGVLMGAFSCGIGVDNIEIVLNEFHALFEYDHLTDEWTNNPPRVNIIRIGTCGSSLKDVPAGAIAVSKYGLGLDNVGAYYAAPRHPNMTARAIEDMFLKTAIGALNPSTYCAAATPRVADTLMKHAAVSGETMPMLASGITTASPGFFAPEGRSIGRIRSRISFDEFISTIARFECDGERIVNHEMETSILFRIGHELLGYTVGAMCLVLDSLATDEVIEKGYADERMKQCIHIALEGMAELAGT